MSCDPKDAGVFVLEGAGKRRLPLLERWQQGLVFNDYPSPSGTLRYNLRDDIGEKVNLAEQKPDKVAELREVHAQCRAIAPEVIFQ